MSLNRFIQTLLGFLLISIVCSKVPHSESIPISYYTLKEALVPNEDESVFTGLLVYGGNEESYVNTSNTIVKNLKLTINYINHEHVQVKIFDADNKRWELPEASPFPFTNERKTYKDSLVTVTFDLHPKPFAFTITRKITEEVIFSTKDKDFIFSNNYIEISTSLPTPNIYGFGERTQKLQLGSGTYSLWNADSKQTFDDGKEGHSSRGFHPVYLMKEKADENWSMVLLRNVNAMSVEVADGKSLTYRVSGGIIDFNIFIGVPTEDQPEGVVTDYHEYLGGWAMPPLWAFGYHQSKSGYDNLEKLTDVILKAKKHDLPLDAIWSDTDYLNKMEDFTIDNDRFSTTEFKILLNRQKKKWVPAINDAIAKDSSFYSNKKDTGVFKKSENDEVYFGKVGEKEVVCFDFFHTKALSEWTSSLNGLKQSVPFSGLWLKTNDIRNAKDDIQGAENNLPYSPTGSRLIDSSINLNIKNALETKDSAFSTEFNTHNINNFLESEITYKYLNYEYQMPFVMAKSSVFGSGKYAGHVIEETNSNWEFLKASIASISSFNMYGIPMTGSDICGSHQDTTEELCARWMQLGTLYPFARNHAQSGTRSQEPWSLDSTVLETSRIALNLRYSLIKYYYYLFLQNFAKSKLKEQQHTGTGTIFRPLFFEFDEDNHLFGSSEATETQFLLGAEVMVAPVVEAGKTSRNVYFPESKKRDEWFDFFTGKRVMKVGAETRTVSISAPLSSTIPIFLREGGLVFTQDTKGVLSTANLNNVYKLVAALDNDFEMLSAKGGIIGLSQFTESNIRQNCLNHGCLIQTEIDVKTKDQSISITVDFHKEKNYYEEVEISGLKLYGLEAQPNIDFLPMSKEETGFDGTTIIRLNSGTLDIKFLTPKVLSFPAKEETVKWTLSIPLPKSKIVS